MKTITGALVFAVVFISAVSGFGSCPKDAKGCPLEDGGCLTDADFCHLNGDSCPANALFCPLNVKAVKFKFNMAVSNFL